MVDRQNKAFTRVPSFRTLQIVQLYSNKRKKSKKNTPKEKDIKNLTTTKILCEKSFAISLVKSGVQFFFSSSEELLLRDGTSFRGDWGYEMHSITHNRAIGPHSNSILLCNPSISLFRG
jgi:hypothetical protein